MDSNLKCTKLQLHQMCNSYKYVYINEIQVSIEMISTVYFRCFRCT